MKLNKRDQQLADYRKEQQMLGPQKQPASVSQINAQQKSAQKQLPHLINPKQSPPPLDR